MGEMIGGVLLLLGIAAVVYWTFEAFMEDMDANIEDWFI